jgi:hypothetical protein
MYGHYVALDRALVAKGFPSTSPWWLATIKAFLLAGKRQLVVRAGRRAGKSSTLCRLAVCLALWGEHDIPPGDLGIVAFVSTTRDEASQRLRTIAAILEALGVGTKPIEFGLEISSRRVGFKSFACSVASVSGPTCIAVIADEVAKWRDLETGANPAKEVLAALRPTMATQPNARMFLVSSPWGVDDAHATAFDAGETEFQGTAYAPTWIANPTLTEQETRALEPEPRTWAREYLASPAEGVSSFTTDEIDGITRANNEAEPAPGARHIIGLDVGLRRDRTAIVVARKEQRETAAGIVEVLCIVHVTHLVPSFARSLTLEAIAKELADVAASYPGTVYADMHYFDAIAPVLKERGIKVEQASMAPTAQTPRIVALQRHLAARTVEIPPHAALRKELLSAVLMHHSGGRLTLKAPERAGMHDDLLAALLLCLDPEVVAKLSAADTGRGVLEYIPTSRTGWFERGAGVFHPDTKARWQRRYANGHVFPAAPPPHHKDFAPWAERAMSEGCIPKELERHAEQAGLRFEWRAGRFFMVSKQSA